LFIYLFVCLQGACVCNVGYTLQDCSSPDPAYLSLEAFDKNMEKEFQSNMPITAIVLHQHPLEMNGKDYIGVYPADSANGTTGEMIASYIPSHHITSHLISSHPLLIL
jgi:hypothetical protein